MPTAAILDVDGTLVDTNYQHALAWYMAFRQYDVTLPVWRIHRHVGMGGDQLVSALTDADFEREHGDAVRSAHDALYLASIDTVSVLDGARELIVALKQRQHPVVLASSAKRREVEHYLDLLGVRELVDATTSAADVDQTKPSPDLMSTARAKLEGGEALMVGDTPWDVRAAAQANVPTIAVLTGGYCASELREAGAIAVYRSLTELCERLGETPLR